MNRQVALISNVILAILEAIGVVVAYTQNGFGLFIYYTQLSNIILMIASITYVIVDLKTPKGEELPSWVHTFKYVGTCLTTVTFLVVIFVLAPFAIPDGKAEVIRTIMGGASLYHHLICPIWAILSYLLIESGKRPDLKLNIRIVGPTVLYAFVFIILNLLRVVEGPYPFLYVYDQPVYMSFVWFVVIIGAAFLIGLGLRMLKKER